jgi:hypothetical protein
MVCLQTRTVTDWLQLLGLVPVWHAEILLTEKGYMSTDRESSPL